ncbi:MAG: DUF87 domain-containing protein [Actinobacteria bacterium]|nr:MAG: DUF87 domain-containing protein [Actinomycetota bacterium]
MPVPVPVGFQSGSHALVLGATGSGKTISEAWIACRLIERCHGAIVIDPKGDALLREEPMLAAARGAPFHEWTPRVVRRTPSGAGGSVRLAPAHRR